MHGPANDQRTNEMTECCFLFGTCEYLYTVYTVNS